MQTEQILLEQLIFFNDYFSRENDCIKIKRI